jgi:hypothetical protein
MSKRLNDDVEKVDGAKHARFATTTETEDTSIALFIDRMSRCNFFSIPRFLQ